MEAWLTAQIPKIFEKNKIELKPEEAPFIYSKVAHHLTKLMDNVIAMISTKSVTQDPKAQTILPRHVHTILSYIQTTCYPKSNKKTQKESKGSHFIETTLNKDLFPSYEIINRLMDLQLNISDHTLQIVKRVLNMHVNCLMMDLNDYQPLTSNKVDMVLALKRHAIFH